MINQNLEKKLNEVGLKVPNILFPREGIDLTKFACIAADQYTQDISYWEKVREYVGDAPSTINLIYPEAELEKEFEKDEKLSKQNISNKIQKINDTMNDYLSSGIYEDIGECFIYVERKRDSYDRKGLLVAIDLEKYDYNVGAKSLMRATELTVKERLVVRRQIREHAVIDLPHILVLINDREDKLFNAVENIKYSTFFDKNKMMKNDILYDFDLMNKSGYIKGYKIKDESDIEKIVDILVELKNKSKENFLYAVGDGNHSLAAAKDIYDKTGRGRYALVELVNLYDSSLNFEPIHRLIIGKSKEDFIKETGIDVDNPPPLQELQKIIDKKNYKIDYIHGKEECLRLAESNNNVAIVYDKFSYETLFDDVIKNGSLCRKSFSIGEAKDKRFYLEAQKI